MNMISNNKMEQNMSKRIAVVTGAARGIGKCIAENLLNKGIKVFALDILETQIAGVCFYCCDIRDEKNVESFFKTISLEEGRIDWLINCAGILCRKEMNYIRDISLAEWREVIDVNLTGAFIVAKYAIPLLEKSNCGNIINLSSDKVYGPEAGSAPYSVSKTGIEMLSKILAAELLDNKIRVNTIAMSSVRTDFIKDYIGNEILFNSMMTNTNIKMPYGLIEPSDVFDTVWFLLSNSKIVGQTILLDSGVLIRKEEIKND